MGSPYLAAAFPDVQNYCAPTRSPASRRSPQPRHCSARSASTATARSPSLASPIAAPDLTAPSSHRISDEEVLAMKVNRFFRLVSITALLSLLAIASGCIVKETSRNNNGDKATESKGAEITTPFGTLRARNEDDGKSHRSRGLSWRSSRQGQGQRSRRQCRDRYSRIRAQGGCRQVRDRRSAGEVLDYYRTELKKFGRKVLECRPNHEPTMWSWARSTRKKSENELTCDKDDRGSGPVTELKVGTDDNQHVVGIEQKGKVTRFALVYVRVTATTTTACSDVGEALKKRRSSRASAASRDCTSSPLNTAH